MRHFFLALAGFSLAMAAGAHAAERAGSSRQAKAAALAASPPAIELTAEAQRVADWVRTTADNQHLPYIIIDKQTARLVLYRRDGTPVAQQPVLIGLAPGDLATPGVGSKNLAEIGTAEKTTPAGRFLARFGLAAGGQRVLWVDYANSVAMHPIPATANPKEQRRQRMRSPDSADHRITFGCINVPKAFYSVSVVPLFRKSGGYIYVLPDQLALDDVFPLLRIQPTIRADAVSVPGEVAGAGTGSDLVR